jgi:hypothetical protein
MDLMGRLFEWFTMGLDPSHSFALIRVSSQSVARNFPYRGGSGRQAHAKFARAHSGLEAA